MSTSLGTFAWPADTPGLVALFLAALCTCLVLTPAVGYSRRLCTSRPGLLLAVLAVAAGALSIGYVYYYLKGGPRIIDATSYFLEGRGFARGHLDLALPGPSDSFRGRFLVSPTLRPNAQPRLGVIFPPGYPALLALGFLCGAPMLVGPLLAVALVLATYKLALDTFNDDKVALLAAFLSTCSATLRYHTADTMSHAWAALLLVLALLLGRRRGRSAALVCGLSIGMLCATRPVTGLVGLLLLGVLPTQRPFWQRPWLWTAAGMAPGILLLLLHQRATTGSFFESSQLRYYALADGPPGCFHFGLGSRIGCQNEHGDFMKLYQPNGYGLLDAAHTTYRRLIMHLRDAANSEVALLAIPVAAVRRYRRGVGFLALCCFTLMLAYAGFYFDGNYPGGGARMFADVLPFEHALLAWSLTRLDLARFTPALVLAGFAFHTSHDQRNLGARDGGRPMFESSVAAQAQVTHGLVFVPTDHGFNLGFDPTAEVDTGVVVARQHNDGHDAALWEMLGRPPAYRYDFDAYGPKPLPKLVPYDVARLSPLRFEAEAEWPPLEVTQGWVRPRATRCTDSERGLELIPDGAKMSATLEVPFVKAGRFRLLLTWSDDRASTVSIEVGELASTSPLGLHEQFDIAAGCSVTPSDELVAARGSERLIVITSSPVTLDRIELLEDPPQGKP